VLPGKIRRLGLNTALAALRAGTVNGDIVQNFDSGWRDVVRLYTAWVGVNLLHSDVRIQLLSVGTFMHQIGVIITDGVVRDRSKCMTVYSEETEGRDPGNGVLSKMRGEGGRKS